MPALDGEILQPGDKPDPADEKTVLDGFWATFGKAAKRIPFAEDVVAAYYCAFDPQTPSRVKAILIAALAYFVFPLDAIPDMLALVGFGDDIAILTVAISSIRSHITDAHREAARAAIKRMGEGKSPLKAR
tara:strand:- start:23 stop:415 length:393 start_codon:yes stop_codon:yes gene_type:complete